MLKSPTLVITITFALAILNNNFMCANIFEFF